ncbi:MAG: hypothetical protein ACOCV7_06650 [Desulfonatronovibrionaceae bacterium]
MSPLSCLVRVLKRHQPLALAFSGGVDSSCLAAVCALHRIDFAAFTLAGPHITGHELKKVLAFRRRYAFHHLFLHFDYRLYPDIVLNSRERCFHCKDKIFSLAGGFFSRSFMLADGTSCSDLNQYRPGLAALQKHRVLSPFVLAGLGRNEVHKLAENLGLNMDGFSRSCVLCRFPYGRPLEYELVLKVRNAENFLLEKKITGFRLRMPEPDRYLLQIDPKFKSRFRDIGEDFAVYLQKNQINQPRLEFKRFDRITGYYDPKPARDCKFGT